MVSEITEFILHSVKSFLAPFERFAQIFFGDKFESVTKVFPSDSELVKWFSFLGGCFRSIWKLFT